MISDLTITSNAEVENTQSQVVTVSTKKISTKILKSRVKEFSKWINPRHWFDSLSDIKITLEEFSCKKKEPDNNN
jgi:hypothetical protein